MIDRYIRFNACTEWHRHKNWGALCSVCTGTGKVHKKKWRGWGAHPKKMVMCKMCDGTGKDPIPWSELLLGGDR